MEKQWAKDINRHFIEKKNMNRQGKKQQTLVVKLKPQQSVSNSAIGKDVDK